MTQSESNLHSGGGETLSDLNAIIDKMLTMDTSGSPMPIFAVVDMRVRQILEEHEGVATIEQLLASVHVMKNSIVVLKNSMVTHDLMVTCYFMVTCDLMVTLGMSAQHSFFKNHAAHL